MKLVFSYLIYAGFFLTSCAPSNFVVPLEKGEHVITASLGGPLVNVPGIATIPLPFTTLGYGYGLSEKSTISGALYPTAAIYGDFQINAGFSHQFWKKAKMAFSGKLGFDYLVDVFEKNQPFIPHKYMDVRDNTPTPFHRFFQRS